MPTRTTIDGPKTSDDKLIMLNSGYGSDRILDIAGRVDDTQFKLQKSGAGDVALEVSFAGTRSLAGGFVQWKNGGIEDGVDFEVFAPASQVTATPGVGNCNLVGEPAILVVPAAGNGSHTIDLYNDAVPVPAPAGNGYYDLDTAGNPTPNQDSPPTGAWNLYLATIQIAHHITDFPIWGDGMAKIGEDNIKPEDLLRQWTLKTTLHNRSGNADLGIRWALVSGKPKGS